MAPRTTSWFEIEYSSDKDILYIRGAFYYDGSLVRANPSGVKFGEMSGKIVGMTAVDEKVFVWYTNMEGYWEAIVGVDPSAYGYQSKSI